MKVASHLLFFSWIFILCLAKQGTTHPVVFTRPQWPKREKKKKRVRLISTLWQENSSLWNIYSYFLSYPSLRFPSSPSHHQHPLRKPSHFSFLQFNCAASNKITKNWNWVSCFSAHFLFYPNPTHPPGILLDTPRQAHLEQGKLQVSLTHSCYSLQS